MYRRYGRHNAAQVANVISYRPRSAVRDMAKALGYSTGQQDAWSKQIDSWGRSRSVSGRGSREHYDRRRAGPPDSRSGCGPGRTVAEGATPSWHSLRRHGADRASRWEVCPIERGRMDNRTVLQWDKDSCAWMGL